MDNKKLNFNFHETFPLQLIYLSEILKLASEKFTGTKEEISNLTGIPTGDKSGKVMPHIKYGTYAGLTAYSINDKNISLILTKLGEQVYKKDPYLLNSISRLLIHYNLTSENGAPQWYFVFRKFPYEFYVPVSSSVIEEKGKHYYGTDIKIGPLKTLYGSSGDFSEISILDMINKNELQFQNKFIEYDKINFYAYTLLKDWEENNFETEIEIDKITEVIKWGKPFGLDYDTVIELLDEIALKGYISLNKQMSPVTIIKKSSSDDLLYKLYED